jgi:CDP-diacylglycerol--serine O-phosphatidyltransferase
LKLLRKLPVERERRRRRVRRLVAVATLPSLVTLGNLLCGFGAIYCAMLSVHADAEDLARLTLRSELLERMLPSYLAIGAYLIFGAMICDALDGRLARLTRRTSDFGGQLDSLADVVSFGVAPAVLAVCLVMPALRGEFGGVVDGKVFGRVAWFAAAVYVACGALRLARFNVENVHDESAHMRFLGLPAPGAAGALASLIVLHEEVIRVSLGWASQWLVGAMPVASLVLAVLMVSRVRYVHFINVYLRGRRPISHLVGIVIVVTVAWIYPQLMLAGLMCGYAMSGVVAWAWRRGPGRRRAGIEAAAGEGGGAGVAGGAEQRTR